MSRAFSSSNPSFNVQAGTQPTLPPPQAPANPNDTDTHNNTPRMNQPQRQAGNNTGHHNPQPNTALPQHHRNLLDSFDHLLREVKPPLANKLSSILLLCESLKKSERDLADLLRSHADHAAVARLRRHLLAFIDNLSRALSSRDATTHLAALEHQHVQAICLGLSVCVPASGPRLFDPSLDDDDCATLQTLTDTLLKQAMRKGLPDGVDANGQVFDILNLVSRLLKVELITPDDVIRECFSKVLVLIDAWTGSDQCRRLISDHNLGRCAVQVATIINYELVDLKELIATTSPQQQPATQGQLLQQCVLALCSDAVLSRLVTAPADAVSLLNVCNTLKDALDKRVLHPASPTLLPALDRLTQVIGTLPQQALAGGEADYLPLANFSNFLRKIGEYRIRQKPVFKDALPAMAAACAHLIGCINHPDFAEAPVDGQALSNLVSFVKYCDKQRAATSAPTSTASVYSPSSSSSPASSSTAGPADQRALQSAASTLTSALLAQGSQCLQHPKSLGGAVIGLAYLWASNLVPRSPELKSLMRDLLKLMAPTPGRDWPFNPRVILPVLKLMLDAGMVTAKDLWLPAQEIERRIGELGAVVETIDALPPLPLPATPISTAAAARKAAARPPANPIGMTSVVATPLLGVFTPPPSTSYMPTNKSSSKAREDKKPKKTFKSRHAPADLQHSTPILIANGSKKKQETVTANAAITTPAQSSQDKAVQSPANKKNQPSKQTTVAAKPSKAKRRSDARSALDPLQRALCTAIVNGDAKQVEVKMKVGGQWNEDRIIGVLDQLQQDLLIVGKNELAALDQFLTKILRQMPQDGASILTDYYAEHPATSGGVLSLLQKHDLFIDIKSLESRFAMLEFIAEASDRKWNALIKCERGQELVSRKFFDGRSLMNAAVFCESTTALDRLLQTSMGQSMAMQMDSTGESPLHCSLSNGKFEAAKKLLKLPSDNEQALLTMREGINPLMIAIKRRASDIVSMLLALPSKNQQAVTQTNSGYNALMQAAFDDQPDVVGMLQELDSAEQQALATNADGKTALILAIEKRHRDVADMLVAHSSAPRQAAIADRSGMNPLCYALLHEESLIAGLLLELPTANDQVRAALGRGINPLALALEHGLVGIATKLLKLQSANDQALLINNQKGLNPLMFAAQRGYTAIAKLLLGLLSANTQSLAKGGRNWTALIFASQAGQTEIVRELLKLSTAKDQLDAKTIDGFTAQQWAEMEGHIEIARLLKDALRSTENSTS